MSATPNAWAEVDDAGDVRLSGQAPAELRPFNQLGVLSPADLHVATRLARLVAEADPDVVLAAALAVRSLRVGHVCVELAGVRHTVATDLETAVDLSGLPWPDPPAWLERVAASPLVAVGDEAPAGRPLRLAGGRLYLDRYWRQECLVAVDPRRRASQPASGVDVDLLAAGLGRLFGPAGGGGRDDGEGPDGQRLAAAAGVLQRLAIVAGGPGTGKTTTVARLLALVEEQAGAAPLRVALAAPTGKAAARLQESVQAEAQTLDIAPAVRRRLAALEASTLHRLLGWRPDSASRFRHDRRNQLPHDVVVVDETSMLSLSLMAKLVEAVRPTARLVLVGDPEQLASVEAGAVLGDLVGPAETGLRMAPAARLALSRATGEVVDAVDPPLGSAIGNGIVVLRRVHRFGSGIAALAGAIQRGAAGEAIDLLRQGRDGHEVQWLEHDDPGSFAAASAALRHQVTAAGQALARAAAAGDAAAALQALSTVRVLCAHRRGPGGAEAWNEEIERWLEAAAESGRPAGVGRWYAGRPLLVTENDYELQLYNGDTGVVIQAGPAQLVAVFERQGQTYPVGPSRLGAVETVHAMTVHKSQGSQFDAVVVTLPGPDSPILTRQLLYTAVTRARKQVTLVASQQSIETAIGRPIARSSGLRQRLWGPEGA